MSKKKDTRAIDKMRNVKPIIMPWNVGRFFVQESRRIDFCNEQASFGEDFGDIHELRAVVDWLADQFGGKIKWEDE